mmetsp:Transcript_8119/g.29961  ORF Transcript_8119/g.29961 Transcript_8119/m.29961 type:complete len:234 (+) Transcript_8119:335-1036(+)
MDTLPILSVECCWLEPDQGSPTLFANSSFCCCWKRIIWSRLCSASFLLTSSSKCFKDSGRTAPLVLGLDTMIPLSAPVPQPSHHCTSRWNTRASEQWASTSQYSAHVRDSLCRARSTKAAARATFCSTFCWGMLSRAARALRCCSRYFTMLTLSLSTSWLCLASKAWSAGVTSGAFDGGGGRGAKLAQAIGLRFLLLIASLLLMLSSRCLARMTSFISSIVGGTGALQASALK